MTGKTSADREAARLRQRAEKEIKQHQSERGEMASQEAERLIHELQVHQIELGIQNESLRQTQGALQGALDQYSDLYHFAPVGYMTLDEAGHIVEGNQTLASWLRVPHEKLINRLFSDFVSPEDQDIAYLYHRSLLKQSRRRPHYNDLRLRREDGTTFYVRLDSQVKADSRPLRIWTVVSDISERKEAEQALSAAHTDLERRVIERTTQLHEQQQLAEALIEIVADLNSSLDLEEVLQRIFINLQRVIPHDTASILLMERNELRLTHYSGDNRHPTSAPLTSPGIPLDHVPDFRSLPAAPVPLVIRSVTKGEYWLDTPYAQNVQSYVSVPMVKDERFLGILAVESFLPDAFDERSAHLIRAFVQHAGLAIWNALASLNQQQVAVLQERQRIAMELHDAVSQTLWSAALIADALPDLWKTNQPKAIEKTAQLSRITHGTLAEMKALLFEIHPTGIDNIPLDQSLHRLVEAVKGRTELPITLEAEPEQYLSPEIRRTFYRVAQEALTNAARHAAAQHIQVTLKQKANKVLLSIQNDGIGFDVNQLSPDGLGLSNMKTRAEAIGATLTVQSSPNQGTCIELQYSTEE